MKDEEKAPSQMGLFDIPRSAAHPDDKVLKVFNKLKRRADSTPSVSGPTDDDTQMRDLDPNIAELQQGSMNSYRVGPDVIKTDTGFEVV